MPCYSYSSFPVSGSTVIINTTDATITGGLAVPVKGEVVNRTFSGPNNGIWNYSVAVLNVDTDEKKTLFNGSLPVKIVGSHSLYINVSGDLLLKADLDVSGREIDDEVRDKLFWLGGFVRQNESCCVLGKYLALTGDIA